MSSTAAVASPYLNGTGSAVPPEVLREAAFLEKLLQIRDQVYAGKHPRIKLLPSVLEQVAPRSTQNTPPVAKQPIANGTPNGTAPLPLFPTRSDLPSQQYQSTYNEYSSSPNHAQRPYSAKSASSGIDPVLLTKSDHLIRAELQLKRQQIERALKDQFDKRGRGNDTLAEDRETFDVEDILAKAHSIVKPVSGLPSARNSEGSESFDENSYYSSKANSWSSEEVDHKAHGAHGVDSLTQQADYPPPGAERTANKPAPFLAPPKQAEPAVIDLDEEPYEPADDIEIYEPEPAREAEDQEESDYSPPPADIGPSRPNRGRGRDRGHETNGTNGSSRRQSPVGNPPPIQNARKRRREEKREERRRQQQANKRVVRSPEPYIKEEPQSPPPFASYPDAQPNKRRALQPLTQDIEFVAARDNRAQPVYYREQDQSPRSFRQFEEPSSPTVVHVPQRRAERDDQDLRRVASLQYARRPYSPGPDLYQVSEPRQVRAASHAFVDRPLEPIYREVTARPSAAPRYVRERSRSPVHEFLTRPQSPVTMAPPPRRIVVDQYGNKYYAAPVDVRESAAPPNRRTEAEPYFERAVTREPTVRAPIRHELYEEGDVQRMPPPPPRRYIEASDADELDLRPYQQREASRRPIEMDYAPREVIERRPVIHYEEMGPPREQVPARAYSMRPEPVRREPVEYTPSRHESVQPGFVRVAAPRYRELSIVQEPFDDRRYAHAAPPQGRRYIEDASMDRPSEAGQEPFGVEVRRVSYRY